MQQKQEHPEWALPLEEEGEKQGTGDPERKISQKL
jgi:hypothetical protein